MGRQGRCSLFTIDIHLNSFFLAAVSPAQISSPFSITSNCACLIAQTRIVVVFVAFASPLLATTRLFKVRFLVYLKKLVVLHLVKLVKRTAAFFDFWASGSWRTCARICPLTTSIESSLHTMFFYSIAPPTDENWFQYFWEFAIASIDVPRQTCAVSVTSSFLPVAAPTPVICSQNKFLLTLTD